MASRADRPSVGGSRRSPHLAAHLGLAPLGGSARSDHLVSRVGLARPAARSARQNLRVPDLSADIQVYLATTHPELAELALWVRAIVLDAEPDFAERLYRGWDGIGYRHPEAGYVCGIFPRGDEVRLLFEQGARLADTDGLLRGTGTQTRFIPVTESIHDLAETLQRYIRAAVALQLFHR